MLCAIGMAACAAALLSSSFLFSQQPASQGAASAVRPPAAKAKATDAGKAVDKAPKLTEDQKIDRIA